MNKKIILICGMHRSGTSFASSLIHNALEYHSDDLVGADKGNELGHFEDEEVVYFHSNILKRNNMANMKCRHPVNWHWTDYRSLERLIKDKFDRFGGDYLVLKDPRASLFLEIWTKLPYEVKVIFLYRDPLSVVSSLVRRGTDRRVKFNPVLGVNTWVEYNKAFLDSYEKNEKNNYYVLNSDDLILHPEKISSIIDSEIKGARDLDLTLLDAGRYRKKEGEWGEKLFPAAYRVFRELKKIESP